MTLSEHVYCVAIVLKMTEQVEQWICIKFCIKLKHFSVDTIQWFRRLQLWATGGWQLYHDNTPAHASYFAKRFLAKHQITQVTQPPYTPDLVPCDFWLFLKLSHLSKRRVLTIDEVKENITRQLMVTGRTVWRPKVPTLKRTGASSIYNVSCILYVQ